MDYGFYMNKCDHTNCEFYAHSYDDGCNLTKEYRSTICPKERIWNLLIIEIDGQVNNIYFAHSSGYCLL